MKARTQCYEQHTDSTDSSRILRDVTISDNKGTLMARAIVNVVEGATGQNRKD